MNAQLLWIVLVGLAVVAVVTRGRRPRSARGALDRPWPLEPVGMLLSEPEQVLYRRLVEALPQYLVFPQVQLGQALRFKRGRDYQGIRNRFDRLSIDFLIVRPDTSIVAAVELDDSSHRAPYRQEADGRKAHALASAGIPLLRWPVGRMPNAEAIRAAVGQPGSVAAVCSG